jgi:hypothetical protein
MKRIVTLVLMMLIGGYGAAQAQAQTVTEKEASEREAAARRAADTEDATKMEEATKEFLGLKWGLGVGVMGGIGGDVAVEKASLVGTDKILRVDEEGDLRPQMFLEMHAFLTDTRGKVKAWKNYQQKKAKYQMENAVGQPKTMPAPEEEYAIPLWGVGPFIALQGSEKEVINALAVGVMWGIRKDPTSTSSVNIGVGVSFDPSVQVLGHGLKEGKALPTGETAVRFKKEGRFGWALMASFTF